MTLAGWQSIYQQSPILVGGEMFPIEKIAVIPALPSKAEVLACARYWDKAGTAGGGAYSSGTLMLRMRDNTYVVADGENLNAQSTPSDRTSMPRRDSDGRGPSVGCRTIREQVRS